MPETASCLQFCSLQAATDPQETFVVSEAQRQVSEWSGRTGRELTEYSSATADLGSLAKLGRQCPGYLPFSS